MQTLAYLLLAVALMSMSYSAWGTAAIVLVMGLLVWVWDGPNRRLDS